MLIDEQATYAKSQVALHKWLKNKITPETTEVVIFFSGHGLAQQGKELYLFARDSDSEALEFTALNRKEIIKRISSYKPKSVLMFFDTCYSGQSRKGETLLAQARPIVPVEPKTGDIPNNFTIFSASSSTQLASAIKKPKHGIFSYYLMKGMEGKADADGNREITNEELYNSLARNVSQKAMEVHDRNQTPSFMGEKDFVISNIKKFVNYSSIYEKLFNNIYFKSVFITLSQAEDVKDFQIEEISVYDSCAKSSNINRSVNAIKAQDFYFLK